MLVKDITLVASYFEDTSFRKENKNKFIEYYTNICEFKILETKHDHNLMKNYNDLADQCKTKYIAFIDIDVLLPPSQIKKSLDMLKSREADFVSPFDQFFDIHKYETSIDKEIISYDGTEETNERLHNILDVSYKFKRDISFIGDKKTISIHTDRHTRWESPFFVGLCVITSLSTYYKFGMGNENFFVHGGADDEWYARAEKLGFVWKQITGPIYHMHHPRVTSDKYSLQVMNNRFELLKICTYTKEELEEYISNCHWIKSRNIT